MKSMAEIIKTRGNFIKMKSLIIKTRSNSIRMKSLIFSHINSFLILLITGQPSILPQLLPYNAVTEILLHVHGQTNNCKIGAIAQSS